MTLEHLQPRLQLEVGQYTSAGVKPDNDDAIGIRIPEGGALVTKGAVVVIADGVSASESGKEAAQTAAASFLSDYYSTHDAWSVQTSASKVLQALNRWLYGQGQKYHAAEKGYVTTLSVLILKSASAYIFHIGDSRVYRLRSGELEQITRDHASPVGNGQRYLARALGIDLKLEVDFHRLELLAGDTFLLTTDGIHDTLSAAELSKLLQLNQDPETSCKALADAALAAGSTDNVSAQLVRVTNPGEQQKGDILAQLTDLPFPPPLQPGIIIDGWRVLKELQASSRSEVYLVEHVERGTKAVLKAPSAYFEDDPAYIERFVLEEWIGQRVQHANVVKVVRSPGRQFLYYLTEYVAGPTLRQLLHERTQLSIDDARNIITQVASGLRAFHRKDALHQDIKPDNIIYTNSGVRIIDFGSVYVASINEIDTGIDRQRELGTLDYSAPEYRLGLPSSTRSDQFSVGVVLYELLSGQHPYGKAYLNATTRKDFLKLQYIPCSQHNPLVPGWMDHVIRRAVAITAEARYEALSEFMQDLKRPNPGYRDTSSLPLAQRDPLLFWKSLSALLFVTCVVLLGILFSH